MSEGRGADLSISIIDTNNRDLTLGCLRSVYASSDDLVLEVFVVDNACTDGSGEAIATEFPQVILLRNEHREGFSTNNNLVLSRATGRHFMLLNDDTVVRVGALERLVAYLDANPCVGAVGASLENEDGSLQIAWEHEPQPLYDALRPLSSRLRPANPEQRVPLPVGSVVGAAMVVRRETAVQVGLLDAAFDPIYSEEIDWCLRIRRAGWSVCYIPDARVMHFGSSTMNREPQYKLDLLHGHKVRLFRKHYGRTAAWTYKIALFGWSAVKILVWLSALPVLRSRAAERVATHRYIFARALSL